MITRRPVQPSDEAFLRSLHESVQPVGLPLPLAQMQYRAEKDAYMATYGECGHEIIEQDGEAIGRWWLHSTDLEIRLVDIRIAPKAQRRGVGTGLLRELQAGATRPILLSVAINNPLAMQLYGRLGFVRIDQTGMHIYMEWRPVVT
jgi:ribosomal protein S18 acetylase RimI-like enzyme